MILLLSYKLSIRQAETFSWQAKLNMQNRFTW
jgi:hypothetical protein